MSLQIPNPHFNKCSLHSPPVRWRSSGNMSMDHYSCMRMPPIFKEISIITVQNWQRDDTAENK